MHAMLLKKLLMIAAVLGVAQGIFTLVGGITSCFDKNDCVFFLTLHRQIILIKMIADGLPEVMMHAKKIQNLVFLAMTPIN